MKNKFLLALLSFSLTNLCPLFTNAQLIGDYRTANSGNWASPGTWEIYNGLFWSAAILSPSSAGGAINIRNGHTVTVSANTTVDQLTIEPGGTLDLLSNT